MELFKIFGLRDQKNQKSKKKPQFSHVLPTMVNKHHEISSSGQGTNREGGPATWEVHHENCWINWDQSGLVRTCNKFRGSWVADVQTKQTGTMKDDEPSQKATWIKIDSTLWISWICQRWKTPQCSASQGETTTVTMYFLGLPIWRMYRHFGGNHG